MFKLCDEYGQGAWTFAVHVEKDSCAWKNARGNGICAFLRRWLAANRPHLGREPWRGKKANNLVENAIRPIAIGKKNWLYFGSEEAGERNAVIYTLIANCQMHAVEPYVYLKDVLERLPTTTNQQVAQLDAIQLEEKPPDPGQAGRLNSLRLQANRSSYHPSFT